MAHKKKILFDQLFVTDKKGGNEKLYSPEMMTRPFKYFENPDLCNLGFNRALTTKYSYIN